MVAIANRAASGTKSLGSLDPHTLRQAVIGDIYVNANGAVIEHKFHIGTIKSKCKLTYHGVEQAIRNSSSTVCQGLPSRVIPNLFGAYWLLDRSLGNKYNSNKLIQVMMELFNRSANAYISKRASSSSLLSSRKLAELHFTSPLRIPAHSENQKILVNAIKLQKESSSPTVGSDFGITRSVHREGCFIVVSHETPREPDPPPYEAKNRIPSHFVRELRRVIPFVTISHEKTAGADQAIFVEKDLRKGKMGWHIMVAVSDVNSIMRQHNILDSEARNRGISSYYPHYAPMLDETSDHKYLLIQKTSHPALVADLYIDLFGHLTEAEFYQAWVRSEYHLSFLMVDSIKNNLQKNYTRGLLDVANLYGAYHALTHNREMRGVEKFKRATYGVGFRPPYESYDVVEEILTLANQAAANFIVDHGVPTIFRVREGFSQPRIGELKDWLYHNRHLIEHLLQKEESHILDMDAEIDKKDMQTILTIFSSFPYQYRAKVENMVFGSMLDEYSHKNKGHSGLGLKNYVHFSNPTYSYANLIVHRAILSIIKKDKDLYPYSEEALQTIADNVARKEYDIHQAWLRKWITEPAD